MTAILHHTMPTAHQASRPPARRRTDSRLNGFTLVELLVVVAVIGILLALLTPSLSRAREAGRGVACLANQRQIGAAARMYMDDYSGGLFHHHEGWVLDDGSQVDNLPGSIAGVAGGGRGNSQAEKPWVIFLQPYLKSRSVAFCPADRTPRSTQLTTDLAGYNGGIESAQEPPPDSELGSARTHQLNLQSYLLNSVFTHRSARYAVEGVLPGFATDSVVAHLPHPNLIMFSERNSEALNAADNAEFGNVGQDDYDTWVGEAALVRWGSGRYADQGWLRTNRHGLASNYLYTDGHAERRTWRQARADQFPDGRVRAPLP